MKLTSTRPRTQNEIAAPKTPSPSRVNGEHQWNGRTRIKEVQMLLYRGMATEMNKSRSGERTVVVMKWRELMVEIEARYEWCELNTTGMLKNAGIRSSQTR